MEAIEAIMKRRSIRKYQPDPVPEEIIRKLIKAGSYAPTARNLQPWEFIVIRDKQLRQQIASITDYGKFIAQAPCCLAVFSQDTKYYLEDGSAATQNILLAATALGLGACWVAGDKKPYCSRIAGLLGVPKPYRLISLVSLGYPEEEAPLPQKRSVDEITHWDKF